MAKKLGRPKIADKDALKTSTLLKSQKSQKARWLKAAKKDGYDSFNEWLRALADERADDVL